MLIWARLIVLRVCLLRLLLCALTALASGCLLVPSPPTISTAQDDTNAHADKIEAPEGLGAEQTLQAADALISESDEEEEEGDELETKEPLACAWSRSASVARHEVRSGATPTGLIHPPTVSGFFAAHPARGPPRS